MIHRINVKLESAVLSQLPSFIVCMYVPILTETEIILFFPCAQQSVNLIKTAD